MKSKLFLSAFIDNPLSRLRTQAFAKPQSSFLRANFQSLENYLDNIRARIKFQRDIRACYPLCLTETLPPIFNTLLTLPLEGIGPWTTITDHLRMARGLFLNTLLGNRIMPPFSSFQNTNKESSRKPQWQERSNAGLTNQTAYCRTYSYVNMFTEVALGFICKLVDDSVPSVTVNKYQKLWVDKTIHDVLKICTATYNSTVASGNMADPFWHTNLIT